MPRKADSQRGGTMLGFIIGGVVGLLAALIVAVFVTKVPVPFVNKAVNRNAEQDQAEAVKNKNWDPNAPLAGKPQQPKPAEATGAVAGASAPAAGASKPADVAKSAAGKGAEKASEKTPEKAADQASAKASQPAAKPPADALGDLVKAKMGQAQVAGQAPQASQGGQPPVVLTPKPPAPAASAAVDVSNAFFVQAGAYANAADAEAQRGKIALSGLEAKVSEREVSGRTVYRVRLGPIEKKPDADKVRERLEALGYDARVMTVSR